METSEGPVVKTVTPQLHTLHHSLGQVWYPQLQQVLPPVQEDETQEAAAAGGGRGGEDETQDAAAAGVGGGRGKVDMEGLNALAVDLKDAWWKLQQLMALSLPKKGAGSSSSSGSSSTTGSSKEQQQQREAGLVGSGVGAEGQQQQRLWLEASAFDVLGMLHVAYENLREVEEDEQVSYGGFQRGFYVSFLT